MRESLLVGMVHYFLAQATPPENCEKAKFHANYTWAVLRKAVFVSSHSSVHGKWADEETKSWF